MPPIERLRAGRRSGSSLRHYLDQITPASLVFLVTGVVLGLIMGLVIGWGLLPVQWTNAWPADLSPEARAQYLAAVADAYVYYGDDQAAEIARNRLFDLNDNLVDEIVAAQRFFAEHPQVNSNVYISNLGQLAQRLGVESPDILVEAPADLEPSGDSAPASAAVGDSVRTWVNWLLTLLAAVVLVGGGIYVIGLLNRRRLAATSDDVLEESPEGFDDDDYDDDIHFRRPSSAASTHANPLVRAARGGPQPLRRAPSGAEPVAGFDHAPVDDYAFDDELEEEDGAFGGGAALEAMEVPRPSAEYEDDDFDSSLEDESAFFADDVASDEDQGLHEPLDDDEGYDELAPAAEVDVDDGEVELQEAGGAEDGIEVQEKEQLEALVGNGEQPAPIAPPSAQRRPADLREIGVFTVHYQAGIPDYDQSYSIMDPEDGRYIGECGMGVNMKNGILQSSPDSVIALDVWLVDKKLEKSYSSQNRVLFSEYVIDHKLDSAFTRERPNDPSPIVPQVGTNFQLKGPSLVLDCKVVEATYSKGGQASGIFQSVQLEMTVRSND